MRHRIVFMIIKTLPSLIVTIIFYLVCCQFLPAENQMSFLTDKREIHSHRHMIHSHRHMIHSHRHMIQRPIHRNDNCTEKKNFVFIKGLKCATSTLLGVFYRFGYTRNLSFVSPLGRSLWLNWPYPMTSRDFRPSRRGYNILTDHSIYTEDVMAAIMPKDTVYISIIREPFAQLQSLFQFFQIAVKAGVPKDVDNPVVAYFSDLKKYESVYQNPDINDRRCVPAGFSLTRNLMSHCLGMPLGFPPGTKDITNDTEAIQQYIQHLDSKFSLIMITEYFYESLVLLRRLMCWSFKDIVFMNYNVGNYSFKTAPVHGPTLNLHRQWSNADYMLYRYFNSTFWRQVSNQGSDFYSEVKTFKHVESQVQNFCEKLYNDDNSYNYTAGVPNIVLEQTKWNKQFSISSEDCFMLGPNPYELIFTVQKENDIKEAHLLAEQEEIPDNRTMKARC